MGGTKRLVLDGLRMAKRNNFLKLKSPFKEFASWFAEANSISRKHPNLCKQPEAFVLSTARKNRVSSRVLLMKEIRKNGFVFYTNYLSTKGQDIQKNPFVAVNFFWPPLFRQVCMRGTVKKISRAESERYWVTRSRESQISQFISHQSQPVSSHRQLEKEWFAAYKRFESKRIPLPKNWGGYLFTPTYIELWVGREARFHDRYAYSKNKNIWASAKLYP